MANEELLVTLGVKDSGATAQIRAFNKEIKALDAQFSAISGTSSKFGTTMTGLGTKLSTLNSKMDVQTNKLTAYRTKLAQANEGIARQEQVLQELGYRTNDNAVAWDKATTSLNRFRQQANEANNGIKLTENQMAALNAEIAMTEAQMNNFRLGQIGTTLTTVGSNMQEFGRSVTQVGNTITDLGRGITAISLPIVALGGYAVTAAVSWESAWAGVTKTVEGTSYELDQLESELRGMALYMPETTTTIAEVAEAAGQLGIKTQDVAEFTEVMVMMGTATNLSATEAAQSLARMANITGLSADEYSNLGATIVDLGKLIA